MNFFSILYAAFTILFVIYMSYALRAYLPLWGWFVRVRDVLDGMLRYLKPSTYYRQRSVEEVLFDDGDESTEEATEESDRKTDPRMDSLSTNARILHEAMSGGLTGTTREISDVADMGLSTGRKALKELRDAGVVTRTGDGYTDSPYVWSIS